jgi:hypothetical protein
LGSIADTVASNSVKGVANAAEATAQLNQTLKSEPWVLVGEETRYWIGLPK